MRGGTSVLLWVMGASELMIDQKEGFNLSQHLGLDVVTDSQAHPTMVQITLKKSITDPDSAKAWHIILGAMRDKVCPEQAPLRIEEEPNPLLMHRDSSALTWPFMMRFRAAMTALNQVATLLSYFLGHSFQAEAAATEAAMKVEDSIIGQMGECTIPDACTDPKGRPKGISCTISEFQKTV